jgi:hypothetical protein
MMRKQRALSTLVALAFLLFGSLAGAARATPLTYHVDVNTAALSGQVGNLDFQFNPGDSSAEAATATITSFQTTGGILAPSASLTGNATGSLPGTVTLTNGTVYNDAFQGVTYGTSLGFDVTLSGAALDQPGGTVGSSFALSLFNDKGDTPLLTTDLSGSVLTVDLNADGTTSVKRFSQSPTNSAFAADANLVSAAPEPSSLLLLASMLPAAVFASRRLRDRAPGRCSTR